MAKLQGIVTEQVVFPQDSFGFQGFHRETDTQKLRRIVEFEVHRVRKGSALTVKTVVLHMGRERHTMLDKQERTACLKPTRIGNSVHHRRSRTILILISAQELSPLFCFNFLSSSSSSTARLQLGQMPCVSVRSSKGSFSPSTSKHHAHRKITCTSGVVCRASPVTCTCAVRIFRTNIHRTRHLRLRGGRVELHPSEHSSTHHTRRFPFHTSPLI